MTGAAAGDHRHAAFAPVAAGDNADGRINIKADEIGVRGRDDEAFDGVVDQLFAVIKEKSGHNYLIFWLTVCIA